MKHTGVTYERPGPAYTLQQLKNPPASSNNAVGQVIILGDT